MKRVLASRLPGSCRARLPSRAAFLPCALILLATACDRTPQQLPFGSASDPGVDPASADPASADVTPDAVAPGDAPSEPSDLPDGCAGCGPCAAPKLLATANGQPLADGAWVPRGQVLVLKGDAGQGGEGCPSPQYQWAVQGPPGVLAVMTPDAHSPQVTYPLIAAGTFTVTLTATSACGCQATATAFFTVPTDDGCRIQLTWQTPLDLDPTDQCGSGVDCGADLDLHVLHPDAQTPGVDLDHDGKDDGWFDVGQYGGVAGDCFWFNPNPCWVADHCDQPGVQPHFLLDATSGATPEEFHYEVPPAGPCYRVGVHYWDDHSFGASYPTVRVWVDGALIYQTATPPKLKKLDLWEVGEACCAAKTFNEKTDPTGGPVIVHDYVNPDFNFTP